MTKWNFGCDLFSCLLVILCFFVKLNQAARCPYKPSHLQNITYYEECESCCVGVEATTSKEVCCNNQNLNAILWAVPFVVIISSCTLLALSSAVYIFGCKNQRWCRKLCCKTQNSDLENGRSSTVSRSSTSFAITRSNSPINPEIKPQPFNVLALPSYYEAAKMRPESPPNYRDLYRKSTLTTVTDS